MKNFSFKISELSCKIYYNQPFLKRTICKQSSSPVFAQNVSSAYFKRNHAEHHITALPAVTVLPVVGAEVVPVPTVVLGTVPVKVVVVPVPTVPVVPVPVLKVGTVSPSVAAVPVVPVAAVVVPVNSVAETVVPVTVVGSTVVTVPGEDVG